MSDFDGYDSLLNESIGVPPPRSMAELHLPKEPLELKDQHLVAFATRNGFLVGRNSVLEDDVASLKRRVREQERMIKEGTEENKRLREDNEKWRDMYRQAERERVYLKQYEPKGNPDEPQPSEEK